MKQQPLKSILTGFATYPAEFVWSYAHMVDIKRIGTNRTFRYGFVRYLLEQDANIGYIQQLFGYESSKTTDIYTHITKKGFKNLKSSLDSLNIEHFRHRISYVYPANIVR